MIMLKNQIHWLLSQYHWMITHIASHSKMTNKRTFSDAMETKHEDNSVTSKKHKVEVEGDLIKVTETKGKKNK